jgi:hypothetical protein
MREDTAVWRKTELGPMERQLRSSCAVRRAARPGLQALSSKQRFYSWIEGSALEWLPVGVFAACRAKVESEIQSPCITNHVCVGRMPVMYSG